MQRNRATAPKPTQPASMVVDVHNAVGSELHQRCCRKNSFAELEAQSPMVAFFLRGLLWPHFGTNSKGLERPTHRALIIVYRARGKGFVFVGMCVCRVARRVKLLTCLSPTCWNFGTLECGIYSGKGQFCNKISHYYHLTWCAPRTLPHATQRGVCVYTLLFITTIA